MNKITKKLKLIIAFILFISSFLYFQFIVPYHIYFKEQIQLFIFDSSYILLYFSKPGGLACLTGDFLTQFFYLKGGGAIVISLLFFIEWLIIVRILNVFGFKQIAPLWALLPVIAEWAVISEISFSIAMPISFALVLFAFFIYTNIQNKTVSIGYGIIFVPFLYMLLGSSMFLFPVIILLYEINKSKKRYLYWLTLIVLAAITPYLLRMNYLMTVNQAYFYPYTGIKQKISSFVIFLILFFVSFKGINRRHITIFSFSLTVLFIFTLGIGSITATTNLKLEKTLGITTEAYFTNWDKVLKISEKSKLENTIAAYYTNIALSKKMQLGDRMMEFYQPFTSGLFLPVNQESNWFIIFFSSDVYYYIGDMNMAQHSATLGTTFSPYQRSVRLIQRLAEINLVVGDIPAAMKYLRMLESSLFHRRKTSRLKEIALTTHPDDYYNLQNKRSQIHTYDTLRNSQNPLLSLELLVKSNPGNQAALDYLLSYYLMSKNITGFFNTYSSYCKGKTNYVPKMYAEALLIHFAVSETDPETIMEYNINLKFVKDFNEYTRIFESTNGNLEFLKKKFTNTYWLFYHFATMKT